jgi:hypothetical protein
LKKEALFAKCGEGFLHVFWLAADFVAERINKHLYHKNSIMGIWAGKKRV